MEEERVAYFEKEVVDLNLDHHWSKTRIFGCKIEVRAKPQESVEREERV